MIKKYFAAFSFVGFLAFAVDFGGKVFGGKVF